MRVDDRETADTPPKPDASATPFERIYNFGGEQTQFTSEVLLPEGVVRINRFNTIMKGEIVPGRVYVTFDRPVRHIGPGGAWMKCMDIVPEGVDCIDIETSLWNHDRPGKRLDLRDAFPFLPTEQLASLRQDLALELANFLEASTDKSSLF